MASWLTRGVQQPAVFTGLETFNVDTNATGGAMPQMAAFTGQQLAAYNKFYGSVLDKTMVAGSRYYSSIYIGNAGLLTGISALVGTTGGTDNWIFELHSPTGVLLATTATAGTTAGTAGTFQSIAFTSTYNLTQPGLYFLAAQSDGNTAKLATLNAPTNPGVYTGSATGVFGTGASITAPTTYTANLGPMAVLY